MRGSADDYFFGGNPDEPVVGTDPFGVPLPLRDTDGNAGIMPKEDTTVVSNQQTPDQFFGFDPDDPDKPTDPFGQPLPDPPPAEDDDEAKAKAKAKAAARKKAAAAKKRAAAKKTKDDAAEAEDEADDADEDDEDDEDDGDEATTETEVAEVTAVEEAVDPRDLPAPVGSPVLVNAAIPTADISVYTDAAHFVDMAQTRLKAKLADPEAIKAFPGGVDALRQHLNAVGGCLAIADPKTRYDAARAALDATYP